MVESIGVTPITGDVATPRVAAAAPPAPVAAVAADSASADVAQTSGLAQSLAAEPPVDFDRVATIKKAIADGRFPLYPATIADRLIALKLQWNPND